MPLVRRMILAMVFVLLAAAPFAAAEEAAPRFVDAPVYFAGEQGRAVFSPQQYRRAVEGLVEQFEEICGDTFCEREFSNLTTLAVDCSIHTTSAAVGACVWTIAGSFAEIDPSTGRIRVTHAVRACNFGLRGDATALARYLAEAGEPGGFGRGLRTVDLPGRTDGKSLYDVLSACL